MFTEGKSNKHTNRDLSSRTRWTKNIYRTRNTTDKTDKQNYRIKKAREMAGSQATSSVTHPFKFGEHLLIKFKEGSLIWRTTQLLTLNFIFSGCTWWMLGEHLWSPEQWLGTTGHRYRRKIYKHTLAERGTEKWKKGYLYLKTKTFSHFCQILYCSQNFGDNYCQTKNGITNLWMNKLHRLITCR